MTLALAMSRSASRASAQATSETSIDVGSLYRRLRPSFVVIRCCGERFGTGFGFGRRGRVATARHVVDCPRGLAAELADGSILGVRVVGVSDDFDLALVELEGPRAELVEPLEARTEPIDVGEDVMSVGFPVGPEEDGPHDLAVTRGVLGQRTAERLVHDALISPGSSGGPLIDRDGRVVGVSVAVPRGSSVGLAEPVEHLTALHEETPPDAADPRDPFDFAFHIGIDYELADTQPFHFLGAELALSASAFDQLVATLRAVALVRFPRTIDGGISLDGSRFSGEVDLGYRLRFDRFPLVFELAGGVSIGNDHVSATRHDVMLVDPECNPAIERCEIRVFDVTVSRDDLLVRPLLALRVALGPITLAYTVLFDVERIEATAHRISLTLGLF